MKNTLNKLMLTALTVSILLSALISPTFADNTVTYTTCTECNGSGKHREYIDCYNCDADGVALCYNCTGSGSTKCSYCSYGKIDCTDKFCEYGTISCNFCGGDGIATGFYDKICPTCGGIDAFRCPSGHTSFALGKSGKLRCNKCGFICTCYCGKVSSSSTCKYCSGIGYTTCTACSGAGYKSCTRCSHNGYNACSVCKMSGQTQCQVCEGRGKSLKELGMCLKCDGSGKITITTTYITPGDCNEDKKINLADASTMLKYIANWDIQINTTAADVNRDGKINLVDVSRILKYIAKWDVVLG